MRIVDRQHWPTLIGASAVFVLAILVRLPSCFDSFWIDELHTAWCIWGDLGQITERAEAGNQTPLYFHLMWFWKAAVGESEVALRMSSVLAVAFASVILVVGVRQFSGSLAAGVLSGSVLALEINSVYFGTEFRAYAFIMLLSVIATWAGVNLVVNKTRMSPGNLRFVFVLAVGAAAMIHPTSLVTLGLLGAIVVMATLMRAIWNRKWSLQLQVSDIGSAILVAAVALSLTQSSLGHSWENRQLWAAFGAVDDWQRCWTMWPWVVLAIVPLVVLSLSLAAGWFKRLKFSGGEVLSFVVPMFVGVLATLTFFCASYYDIVPLWHRRYFIAALPMFAWSVGACYSPAATIVRAHCSGTVKSIVVSVGVIGYLAALLSHQQHIGRWHVDGQFVKRHENWREVVEYVQANFRKGDRVYLESGLIETRVFTMSYRPELAPSQIQWQYFDFPLSGPYHIPSFTLAHRDAHSSRYPGSWSHVARTGDIPSILIQGGRRASRDYCDPRLEKYRAAFDMAEKPSTKWVISRSGWRRPRDRSHYPTEIEFHDFGTLLVVEAKDAYDEDVLEFYDTHDFGRRDSAFYRDAGLE